MKRCTIFATIWALSASPLLAQTVPLPQEHEQPLVAAAPAATTPALPTVSSLFGDLARDFRRLPSRETALVLGIAAASSVGMWRHDRSITARLTSSATLDRVFEIGEMAGNGLVQGGAAMATYAMGRIIKNSKVATVGADLVRGQMLNFTLTQGVKFSVRRARPDGGRYSFPSGHASSSFAFASVLGRHLGWRVSVPAHTIAAYVAASRLQENRHFATDIAIGAAMGMIVGRTATIGRDSARFVVSPVASAGVAGVAFTWIGRP